MGRKRKLRLDLPERVYYRHGAYYLVHASGKWEKLDVDYAKAMAKWATLINRPTKVSTMSELLDRYILEVIPHKGDRTQKDNIKEARFLRAFFGAMGVTDVLPHHIAQYRDSRAAKTRGNREIALLSNVFTKACEWGYATRNPCREVKRNKENERDRYVTDEELEEFKKGCPTWIQLYIELKVMTGLRQQDLLALKWQDVRPETLFVAPMKTQRTTRKKLNIILSEELHSLLNSMLKQSDYLFSTRQGNPYSESGFASIWQRLMKKFELSGHARFHEHDIRGKTATDMDYPIAAQRLLGHASLAMTEKYIKQRKVDVVQPNRRK